MNYLPLYIKTEYSLLESMITIDSLISFAKENNLKSLTITDNNMYGAMEFYTKCVKNDIKPIIGLEIKIDNKLIVLYAKDSVGYKNLVKLSSIDRILTIDDLKEYSKSLILIVPYKYADIFEMIKDYYENSFIGYQSELDKNSIKYNKVFFSKSCYFTKEDIPYYKYLL